MEEEILEEVEENQEDDLLKDTRSTYSQQVSVLDGDLGFFGVTGIDHEVPMKGINPKDLQVQPDEIFVSPDGDWGWMIVFIAFVSNTIVDGTIFSFAVVQNAIINLYIQKHIKETCISNDTRCIAHERNYIPPEAENIAWSGSLFLGFNFLSGPLASAVAAKFGFRAASMMGSFATGIAFMISALSAKDQLPILPVLLICYGLIGGTGSGMISMPSVVCVGYYFEKKRALAVGLAISGSGCGTFVFAFISKILIEMLGWQGMMLIQGIMLFSCSMVGSLYRTPDEHRRRHNPFYEIDEMAHKMRDLLVKVVDPKEKEPPHKHEIDVVIQKEEVKSKSKVPSLKEPVSTISITSGTNVDGGSNADLFSLSGSITDGIELSFGEGNSTHVLKLPDFSEVQLLATGKGHLVVGSTVGQAYGDIRGPQYVIAKAEDEDESSGDEEAIEQEQASIIKALQEAEKPKPNFCGRLVQKIKSVQITRLPCFWIIAFGGFFTSLGYPIVYIYLGALAIKKGINPEKASGLLYFIGMTNTIGRILCGYFSDNEKANPLYINNITTIIAGLATLSIPFLSFLGYGVFVAFAVIFGSTFACFVCLRSILIRDYIGLSCLNSAFGLCLAFQGAAAIAASPMAASLYKMTKDYTIPFVIAGGLMIIPSAFSFLLPFAFKAQTKWEEEREALEEAQKSKHS